MRKKSKLDSEIIQNLLTDPSVPESLLSGQQDLRLSTGSSSVSEYAGTSASSTIQSDVSRRRVSPGRSIQQEKIEKQPSFTVDNTTGLLSLSQIRSSLDYTLLGYSAKLPRFHWPSKTLKRLVTLLHRDGECLPCLEEKLRQLLRDTDPMLLSGALITRPCQKTGVKRTSKNSSSRKKSVRKRNRK